jgi:RHS repeat-associated protein
MTGVFRQLLAAILSLLLAATVFSNPYDQLGTDTYDYDAFGNLIHSTGTTANNYLFAGEQFDPDLNLYYNRARYLNTSTGRFWSMDTEEGGDQNPMSRHKYLYAEDEPVNGADPSGNDDLTELTAGFGVSETLDTMPVPRAANANQKLGIGIEVPPDNAVKNNVFNVAVDPGHAFVYLRELGAVLSILSFGPGAPIVLNQELFREGSLPGNAHWKLDGNANTWEWNITPQELWKGTKAIADFKTHVPKYTAEFQCTSAALSIAKQVGLGLPDGIGPVIAEEFGHTFFKGNVSNPYHLNQEMIRQFGPPRVVSTSTFPAP